MKSEEKGPMARRKSKRSNRKIIEMVILFVVGTWLLVAALKAGTDLAVPYDYDEIIETYSKEYKVEKTLVAAVIYQESRYRPAAVSSVGATGLMQIMPDTAQWLSSKMNVTYKKSDLMNPDYNIRMGTYYLNYLLKKYNGDEKLALAAYNAGPGNVDGWLRDERYSDGGNLTEIPFKETRDYVPNVIKMKDVYQSLYSGRFQVKP